MKIKKSFNCLWVFTWLELPRFYFHELLVALSTFYHLKPKARLQSGNAWKLCTVKTNLWTEFPSTSTGQQEKAELKTCEDNLGKLRKQQRYCIQKDRIKTSEDNNFSEALETTPTLQPERQNQNQWGQCLWSPGNNTNTGTNLGPSCIVTIHIAILLLGDLQYGYQ